MFQTSGLALLAQGSTRDVQWHTHDAKGGTTRIQSQTLGHKPQLKSRQDPGKCEKKWTPRQVAQQGVLGEKARAGYRRAATRFRNGHMIVISRNEGGLVSHLTCASQTTAWPSDFVAWRSSSTPAREFLVSSNSRPRGCDPPSASRAQ